MSDGVLLTRFFVFVLLGWPILAVSFVYQARRSSISRSGTYFLKSIALAYGLSLLGPIVMLALFWALGMVPEVATFYTIIFGIPLFMILPILVALRVARGAGSFEIPGVRAHHARHQEIEPQNSADPST